MSLVDQLRLAELEPVGLDTVLATAPLARRVDRKYLVPLADATRLVAALADSHHVLEISGRRCTTYRSTYLDTDDLQLCRAHLQGRRLRWKARSRLYLEDGLCRFEVKVRGARDETVKHSVDLDPSAYGRYGQVEQDFIAGVVDDRRCPLGGLRPVVEVGYTRATLVDLDEGTRLTIDHGTVGRATSEEAADLRDGTVAVDRDRVIVETKTGHRPGAGDRVLGELGHRPLALSKYATSAALLARSVPDNHVRRLVGRGVTVDDPSARAFREAS